MCKCLLTFVLSRSNPTKSFNSHSENASLQRDMKRTRRSTTLFEQNEFIEELQQQNEEGISLIIPYVSLLQKVKLKSIHYQDEVSFSRKSWKLKR